MAYPANNAPMSPPTAAGPSNSRSMTTGPNPGNTSNNNNNNTPPLPSQTNTTTTNTNNTNNNTANNTNSAAAGASTAAPQQTSAGPAPPSKRDKRRTALQEKYKDLTDAFANTRDSQFRQNVQELQNEMALISCARLSGTADADTGSDKAGAEAGVDAAAADNAADAAPLSDAPEDVAAQLRGMAARNQIMSGDAVPSGRWYAGFVQEGNRIKEDRDAGLADLKVGASPEVLSARSFLTRTAYIEPPSKYTLPHPRRTRLPAPIGHRRARQAGRHDPRAVGAADLVPQEPPDEGQRTPRRRRHQRPAATPQSIQHYESRESRWWCPWQSEDPTHARARGGV